ncbi:cytochrome c oxidase subunit II [Acaryochloris sp. CCMEE 5410]|uniref:cytochrome c oxidase subunit II n=1 Tax=Acaryochloris sp. CCMEE 5410 TaxID=310037 RepID=UPI00024849AD|nr:cytochrome c oxidase subunit II [Acaryochloris sp. CCMEE 5410]KAI9133292.1 cytochrome c oxidase subunit II [Acaryochloris sp. CCMEE 5410]
MKVPTAILTLIIGILITLASLWVSQNNDLLLPIAAASEAAEIDRLFASMMAIATGLFLIVQGALLYSLFAFRRKSDDQTDAEPVHGNVPLEIVWTAIPAMLVLWLGIYSFDVYQSIDSVGTMGSHNMAHQHGDMERVADADAATMVTDQGQMYSDALSQAVATETVEPLQVNVDGLQYAWLFTYPDTGIISGELHLPVNRPVTLNITARDVIHAFWVPEFRLKQDAVPGQVTHLNFQPTEEGVYPVICAELCGAYHGAMKTRSIVHSGPEYQAWVDSQLVANTSKETVAQSITVSPLEHHAAAMGLPHHLHKPHQSDLAQVDHAPSAS